MPYRKYWRQDLAAGLTTAVMLVPQGMAYALLAGLPPIVGLYAATLPLLVYAALGTSRQLALGPMALSSILVATGIAQLGGAAELGTDEYLGLAVVLTLVVGMWQTLLGALRLGGLVNLMSHPVVSGFTAAAAFIIGASQLIKDAIYRQVAEKLDTVALVLDASSINALDSTAVDTFEEIVLGLRNRGIEVMVSHVKGPVLHVLQIAGVVDTLGEGHIFYEVQDAVSAALRHRDAVEQGVSLAEEDFGLSDMVA